MDNNNNSLLELQNIINNKLREININKKINNAIIYNKGNIYIDNKNKFAYVDMLINKDIIISVLINNDLKSENDFLIEKLYNKELFINKINKVYINKKMELKFQIDYSNIIIAGNINKTCKTIDFMKINNEKRKKERELLENIRIKNIAVITSKESDGCADFQSKLEKYKNRINIEYFFIKINKIIDKEKTINIIKKINEQKSFDIICFIRGGGDESVLLEDLDVITAINNSKIPTLVGIGHANYDLKIKKVADIVAITPTDAAQKIIKIINKNDYKFNYFIYYLNKIIKLLFK